MQFYKKPAPGDIPFDCPGYIGDETPGALNSRIIKIPKFIDLILGSC